jgi:hypothetical protein
MWRLALVLCLLPACAALAAETRGQIQVGLIITGIPKPAATGSMRAALTGAVPLPRARPAALGASDTASTAAGGTHP